MNLAYMNKFRYWLITIVVFVYSSTVLAQDINSFWTNYANLRTVGNHHEAINLLHKYETAFESSCRMETHMLWKVPTNAVSLSPVSLWMRWRISRAALLVKVTHMMLLGITPRSFTRYANRRESTWVFPEPAPAITSCAPSQYSTAAR